MDMVSRLKILLGEDASVTTNDELLQEYLNQARDTILETRFPFGPPHGEWPDEVESRYKTLQVKIAEAMYNKRGGRYEMSHTENGVSRTWDAGDVPKDLLSKITPYCEVL